MSSFERSRSSKLARLNPFAEVETVVAPNSESSNEERVDSFALVEIAGGS